MRESMLAVQSLDGATFQPTYRHNHPALPKEHALQSRPDIVFLGENRIVDVKTTSTWEKWFSRYSPAHDFGYVAQMGMAAHFGEMTLPSVDLLVVESVYPHRSMLVPIHQDALELGWRWADATAKCIGECFQYDSWPTEEREAPMVHDDQQLWDKVYSLEARLAV